MTTAFVVLDQSLLDILKQKWPVERVTEWDDSGKLFVAIQYERAGVYDLVVDASGVRLNPDADV